MYVRPKFKKSPHELLSTFFLFLFFFIACREDEGGRGETESCQSKKKGLLRSLTRPYGRHVACAFCVPLESYFMFLFALLPLVLWWVVSGFRRVDG